MFEFLVPLLIAIVILVLGITVEVASVIEVISTVGWIMVIGLSIIIILISIFRKSDNIGSKIAGIIVTIISSIISLLASKTFLVEITTMDKSGFEIISFFFVITFGGMIWLSIVGLCTAASYMALNSDEEDYLTAGACLLGSLALAFIFGFLG